LKAPAVELAVQSGGAAMWQHMAAPKG
jgi:hypothetical protein